MASQKPAASREAPPPPLSAAYRELLDKLAAALPNLKFLICDPVRLVITYEQSHYRKMTEGSAKLRVIMNKFNKVDARLSSESYGPPYTGREDRSLSRSEGSMRDHILKCDLGRARASKILGALDGEKPWGSRFEFIQALAALTCYFRTKFSVARTLLARPLSTWCGALLPPIASNIT